MTTLKLTNWAYGIFATIISATFGYGSYIQVGIESLKADWFLYALMWVGMMGFLAMFYFVSLLAMAVSGDA